MEDRRTERMETRVVAAADRLGQVDADRSDLSRVQARDRELDADAAPPAALSGYATTSRLHIQGL